MLRFVLLLIPTSVAAQPPLFGTLPLPNQNPTTEQIVGLLIRSFDDADSEVRFHAAIALANIGTPAVDALSKTLGDPRPNRRIGAATALANIGPAAKPALPNLLRALQDSDVGVRRQAAYAVGRILTPPPPTLPTIDPPPPERIPSIGSLGPRPVP